MLNVNLPLFPSSTTNLTNPNQLCPAANSGQVVIFLLISFRVIIFFTIFATVNSPPLWTEKTKNLYDNGERKKRQRDKRRYVIAPLW
jgi:hypothetical protein